MPQTNFGQNERSLTDLVSSEFGPAVVVRPDVAEPLRTRAYTSVLEPIRHPARDCQMILTTLEKDGVTVRYIDPHKSDDSSNGKVLSVHTHDVGSETQYWPQGSRGPRFPITQDSCVLTQDGWSIMFGRDGSVEGPYPSQPTLSIPPPLIQPPTHLSNASQGPLQHHFDLRYPAPSGLITDRSGNVVAVDLRCLSLNGDFTHGELTDSHEFFDRQSDNARLKDLRSWSVDFVNNHTANADSITGQPIYQDINGGIRPTEQGGSINEEVGMQSALQPEVQLAWEDGWM
jgi:hypothetical protein